ncbi:hypothetical protein M378DRAFT_161627 [Amanita muscaria Koide BX008]|uniref:Uncharacterized protein n=1 Tax=Amanita muscaria (strain Koide BX008) TaxID=946122 RepID=A0A0C2TGF2_AMAMK|nr:hypothetical protein M378DRAFT_161627 [Amanita muscaria Koide BX008]
MITDQTPAFAIDTLTIQCNVIGTAVSSPDTCQQFPDGHTAMSSQGNASMEDLTNQGLQVYRFTFSGPDYSALYLTPQSVGNAEHTIVGGVNQSK